MSSNQKRHITVLIDGDGALFNEDLVLKSVEGGITAANLLDQGIRHYLWGSGDLSQTCNMFAYMFMNKQGLSAAMADFWKDDPRFKPSCLDNFLSGFTQHKLFLAIDAGQRSQAADTKIFERLEVEIEDAEHIILVGIAHDYGYENRLKQCKGYERFNHKLHLLKTYKDYHNHRKILRMFKPRIFTIEGLFLEQKLEPLESFSIHFPSFPERIGLSR
ncbi:hypothetical protein H1R20_g12049, partial [Candolleomyces eurysporus]